ncbi:MAG TPA: cytochrome c [Blastocatellia bacterium]|nr:cytochrome c [Blastocatellia bacterium]
MKRTIAIATVILSVIVLCWMLSVGVVAKEKKSPYVEKGRKLFLQYCASCHGPSGRGEGKVAALLKNGAPDLTLLQPPGEKFPFYRVQTTIDGEKAIDAHGTSQMPVWGTVFRKTSGELQRNADIYSLVKFVESIQRNGN